MIPPAQLDQNHMHCTSDLACVFKSLRHMVDRQLWVPHRRPWSASLGRGTAGRFLHAPPPKTPLLRYDPRLLGPFGPIRGFWIRNAIPAEKDSFFTINRSQNNVRAPSRASMYGGGHPHYVHLLRAASQFDTDRSAEPQIPSVKRAPHDRPSDPRRLHDPERRVNQYSRTQSS